MTKMKSRTNRYSIGVNFCDTAAPSSGLTPIHHIANGTALGQISIIWEVWIDTDFVGTITIGR